MPRLRMHVPESCAIYWAPFVLIGR